MLEKLLKRHKNRQNCRKNCFKYRKIVQKVKKPSQNPNFRFKDNKTALNVVKIIQSSIKLVKISK